MAATLKPTNTTRVAKEKRLKNRPTKKAPRPMRSGAKKPRMSVASGRKSASGGIVASFAPLRPRVQATHDLRLVSPVRRHVIGPLFGKIGLIDERVGMIVAVLITRAVSELGGPLIMGVAQMRGHGQ